MLRKKAWVWGLLLAVFLLADAALLLSVLTAPISLSAALVPTAEFLEQNPAPTLEFVKHIEIPRTPCHYMPPCVSIEIQEQPLARMGVDIDLSKHIFENSVFTLDGYRVNNLVMAEGTSFECEDQDSNSPDLERICWGLGTTFYLNLRNLSSGLHLAEMHFTDPDGIEHSYSWAFRYDPNFPTPDPNVLPTSLILPTLTPSN